MFSVWICDGTFIGDSTDPGEVEEMVESALQENPGWDCYIRQGQQILTVARLEDDKIKLLKVGNAEQKREEKKEKPPTNEGQQEEVVPGD